MIEILLLPVLGLIVLQVLFFLFVPKASTHLPSDADVRLLRLVRRVGIAVLVVGMVAAGWVYRHTDPVSHDRRDIIGYETSSFGDPVPVYGSMSKKYALQEERMGGKFGVMLEKVVPWFSDQWHGRRLATTCLVISGAIFLGCFFWARILTFPDRSEPTSPAP